MERIGLGEYSIFPGAKGQLIGFQQIKRGSFGDIRRQEVIGSRPRPIYRNTCCVPPRRAYKSEMNAKENYRP